MCNSNNWTVLLVITVLLDCITKRDFPVTQMKPLYRWSVWVTLVAMVLEHNTTDIYCGFLSDCIIVIFATLSCVPHCYLKGPVRLKNPSEEILKSEQEWPSKLNVSFLDD